MEDGTGELTVEEAGSAGERYLYEKFGYSMSEDPSWMSISSGYSGTAQQVHRRRRVAIRVDSERALRALEEHWASLRLIELQDNPILGLFDYDHMKAIHRHIFQDVYEWAGVSVRPDAWSVGQVWT